MARMRHGETVSLQKVKEARLRMDTVREELELPVMPVRPYGATCYDYMFPKLQQGDSALLPQNKQTVAGLVALANTMCVDRSESEFDSSIPAAYTYLGQFINHDISFEVVSDSLADLENEDLQPLTLKQVRDSIYNRRSPTLDLDSVYGATADGAPVPRQGCTKLAVGTVCVDEIEGVKGERPKGKDVNNDLPRKRYSENPKTDREALIGDPRNDDNLILSQLHLSFLRAHNTIVDLGFSFKAAKRILTEHFQYLVINDFLGRVADPEIRDEVLTYGNRFFRSSMCELFMPLEFSAAAFRFGHSMIRGRYDYNKNFEGENGATLELLVDMPSFRRLPKRVENIPQQWIIEWNKFLDAGTNRARLFDTRLVDPLAKLINEKGELFGKVKRNLAARNLLRAYLLRIPTGQQVAQACGIEPLTEDEILGAATEDQRKVLSEYNFHKQTPLWYYILTEANGRSCLGPVGSTIVCEVLIGLVRWTEDSILTQPGWKPTLGSKPGKFFLDDLFQLADVWR